MNKIASAYSHALFLLAMQENKESLFEHQLDQINSILNAKTLFAFNSVEFTKDNQIKVIQEVFKDFDASLVNFLCVLVENNRLNYLSNIVDGFTELMDEKNARIKGIIYSANDLSENQIHQIELNLSNALHKEVLLTNEIDSELIGGFKIFINGKIYDYSLSNQMNELRKQLKKGGRNHE